MRISDWSSDVCSSDLQRVSHGERGAQRAGITAAHVNDNIVIFGRELADLAAKRRAGVRNGGIASLPKSIGAQLGKGEGDPLLVAVHKQEVAARKRARPREVDGKGRLSDTAPSASDCQSHSALAPLAIWLRCSLELGRA